MELFIDELKNIKPTILLFLYIKKTETEEMINLKHMTLYCPPPK